MDINSLLIGMDCKCGKHHDCAIEKVYIEKNAATRFKELLRPYTNILLVADQNTYNAFGAKVVEVLNDKSITKVIFRGDTILVPDEAAVENVERNLNNAEIIVGIGSGVIQDLCKFVSFNNKLEYIIGATAPSMDGYASTGAAMIMGGMKVTYSAHVPKAIVADTDVLKNAPMEMIKSGYGDIVGKYSALNDWKLSHVVYGEEYCEYVYSLIYKMLKNTLTLADGLIKRDEESVKTLMEAIVVVGIAMAFVGSSRPASGSEHHLSHYFEIVGILKNEEYLLHGTDVAYSTVITQKLRERILKIESPEKLYQLTEDKYKEKMQELYMSAADGCMELQEKIGRYKEDRLKVYKDNWQEIKEVLSLVPSAEEIEKLLANAEMSMDEFYNIYTEEKIQNATWFAKDLKDRYTVLWLYYDLFCNEI